MQKNIKWIEITLKICLTLLFTVFLSWELLYKQDSATLWQVFIQQVAVSSPYWLVATLCLVPINWLLEALKWRILLSFDKKITIWIALKSVLSGVAVGIFTPNRIGEYGGRALFVPRNQAIESMIATLLCGFSQFFVTVSFGLIGLYFFSQQFFPDFNLILNLLLLLGLLACGIVLFFFYNIDLLLSIIKRVWQLLNHFVAHRFLSKKRYIQLGLFVKNGLEHIKVLKNYSYQQLSQALFLAIFRYFVYATQYYLVLQFMGIHAEIGLSCACIATIYLLQTSIPLPPLTGLVARGSTAVYVWSFFNNNDIAILATTFGLWLVNVILPALLGLIFILQVNYFSIKNDATPTTDL